jgi:hypothetical protein
MLKNRVNEALHGCCTGERSVTKCVMNKPLVLTSEHARHPFRRSLPAHVLRPLPSFEPEVIAAQERAFDKREAISGLTLSRGPSC